MKKEKTYDQSNIQGKSYFSSSNFYFSSFIIFIVFVTSILILKINFLNNSLNRWRRGERKPIENYEERNDV